MTPDLSYRHENGEVTDLRRLVWIAKGDWVWQAQDSLPRIVRFVLNTATRLTGFGWCTWFDDDGRRRFRFYR